jgi:Flp pilus assembly protein TadD
LRQLNPKAALAVAEEAVAANPKQSRLLELLGNTQMAVGASEDAVRTFQELARLRPQELAPLLKLAAAQAKRRDFSGAARTLRQAQQFAPNNTGIARDLVSVHLAATKFDDALGVALVLQVRKPGAAIGHVLEGDVHAARQKWPEAERAYRTALKLEPQSSDIAIGLCRVLSASGRKSETAAFARNWISRNPADVPMRMYVAETALHAKNYKAAGVQYETVLRHAKNNVLALNNLAWTLGELKDPRALGFAERALEFAPNSSPVLDTLGMLHVEQGDQREAWSTWHGHGLFPRTARTFACTTRWGSFGLVARRKARWSYRNSRPRRRNSRARQTSRLCWENSERMPPLDATADRTWHTKRSVAWIIAVLVVVLVMFWQTTWSMVQIWKNSGTYSHGFLILPVFLWLVWDRRLALSRLPIRPSWLALFGLAVTGLVWLIGDAASANVLTQFAVVAMMPFALATSIMICSARPALTGPLCRSVRRRTGAVLNGLDCGLRSGGACCLACRSTAKATVFDSSGDWSVIEACSDPLPAACSPSRRCTPGPSTGRTRRILFVTGAFVIATLRTGSGVFDSLVAISWQPLGTGFDHRLCGSALRVVLLLCFGWDPERRSIRQPVADEGTAIAGSARRLYGSAAFQLRWPLPHSCRSGRWFAAREASHAPLVGSVISNPARVGFESTLQWHRGGHSPESVTGRLQTFEKDGRRVSVYLGS